MGLLDEAIREHLELKRRSGADPGAIAQAEHEALDPIFPGEPRHEEGEPSHEEGTVAAPAQDVDPIPPPEPAQPFPGDADFSNVGQETAEIDMRTVLEQDSTATIDPAGSRSLHAGPAREIADAELDWEVTGRHGDPVPEEIPGQERLTFE